MPTCTADAVTAATVTDDDIVRYWTLFSSDDETVAVNIAGCEHSSETLARSVIAGIESPQLAAEAFAGMLSATKISEVSFVELLRHAPLSDSERFALLENRHCGRHIATHWDDLDATDRDVALGNEALPGELIAAHWRDNISASMWNPATPTEALEGIADALGVRRHRNGAPHEWALVNHPNAPASWKECGAVPAEELEELNEIEPATGERRDVVDLGCGAMCLDVMPLIRCLDDEFAAATSMVRSGFEGTVGELLEVARTFH